MSVENDNRPYIGVGVILWKGDQVLMGKRIGSGDDVCWQFPGGHLEADETVIQCARRELLEETGLEVQQLHHAGYTDRAFMMNDRRYLTLFVSAQWWQGEPKVIEQEKCECWQWFDHRRLPQPLFAPIDLFLDVYGDLKTACVAGGTR